MRHFVFRLLFVIITVLPQWAMAESRTGYLIDLEGTLTPASVGFVQDIYQQAQQSKEALIVLRVKAFDAPDHVLTSLGVLMAQTPVPSISYVMTLDSPSAAIQQLLANSHLVAYQSASAIPKEANGVIVETLSELMAQLDGHTMTVQDKVYTLSAEDLVLQETQVSWRYTLISVLTSPNMIFLLIVITIYAFLFEWARPGNVRAATIGSVSLLLSIVAMHYQHANYLALLGIAIAILLMCIEAQRTRNGWVGLIGISLYFLMSANLMNADKAYQVSVELIIIGFVLISGMLLLTVTGRFNRKYLKS